MSEIAVFNSENLNHYFWLMSGDSYKIAEQEAPYFVTFTIINWIDVFTRKDYKLIITDSLNYCRENKGLEVFAWVIMSNHIHLIIRSK